MYIHVRIYIYNTQVYNPLSCHVCIYMYTHVVQCTLGGVGVAVWMLVDLGVVQVVAMGLGVIECMC